MFGMKNHNYKDDKPSIDTICTICGKQTARAVDQEIMDYIEKNNVPLPLKIECRECGEGVGKIESEGLQKPMNPRGDMHRIAYKVGWTMAVGGLALSVISVFTNSFSNERSWLECGVVIGFFGMIINLMAFLSDPKVKTVDDKTAKKVYDRFQEDGRDIVLNPTFSNHPSNIWRKNDAD